MRDNTSMVVTDPSQQSFRHKKAPVFVLSEYTICNEIMVCKPMTSVEVRSDANSLTLL
jgi:hypothetical protein